MGPFAQWPRVPQPPTPSQPICEKPGRQRCILGPKKGMCPGGAGGGVIMDEHPTARSIPKNTTNINFLQKQLLLHFRLSVLFSTRPPPLTPPPLPPSPLTYAPSTSPPHHLTFSAHKKLIFRQHFLYSNNVDLCSWCQGKMGLNLVQRWRGTTNGIPSGCSWRFRSAGAAGYHFAGNAGERHFNLSRTGRGRGDIQPICVAPIPGAHKHETPGVGVLT